LEQRAALRRPRVRHACEFGICSKWKPVVSNHQNATKSWTESKRLTLFAAIKSRRSLEEVGKRTTRPLRWYKIIGFGKAVAGRLCLFSGPDQEANEQGYRKTACPRLGSWNERAACPVGADAEEGFSHSTVQETWIEKRFRGDVCRKWA